MYIYDIYGIHTVHYIYIYMTYRYIYIVCVCVYLELSHQMKTYTKAVVSGLPHTSEKKRAVENHLTRYCLISFLVSCYFNHFDENPSDLKSFLVF